MGAENAGKLRAYGCATRIHDCVYGNRCEHELASESDPEKQESSACARGGANGSGVGVAHFRVRRCWRARTGKNARCKRFYTKDSSRQRKSFRVAHPTFRWHRTSAPRSLAL